MIEIMRLRLPMIDQTAIDALNQLAPQLSEKSRLTVESKLDNLLSNPNFCLMAALDQDRNHYIVGVATIFFQNRLFSPTMAHVDDVVLDKNYRGQGIGERLICELLDTATTHASRTGESITVELTSRPKEEREAARHLYQKIGFEIVAKADSDTGTDLFRKKITPLP